MAKRESISSLWKKGREEAKKQRGEFGELVPVAPGKYVHQFMEYKIGDFGGIRQVLATFATVSGGDDDEERGKLCKVFLGLSEDKIQWFCRALMAMGVDLDETELDTEKDVAEVLDKLIEECTCVNTKVVEKDGYTNMYLNDKAEGVENDQLFDASILKGDGAQSGDKKDEGGGDEGGDGEAFEEGDVIKFKHPKTKKFVEGEIIGFDKDDNGLVKVEGEKKAMTVDLSEAEKVEAEEPESKKDEPDPSEAEVDFEEGDIVTAKHKGKERAGVVEYVQAKAGVVAIKFKGEPAAIKFKKSDVTKA